MRSVALGLVLFSVAIATARADILASQPTFDDGQIKILCIVNNTGTTGVTLSAARVAAELAPFSLPIDNRCSASLAAGQVCAWWAFPQTGGAHLCRVTVSNKTNVRGTMEISNDTGRILAVVAMR